MVPNYSLRFPACVTQSGREPSPTATKPSGNGGFFYCENPSSGMAPNYSLRFPACVTQSGREPSPYSYKAFRKREAFFIGNGSPSFLFLTTENTQRIYTAAAKEYPDLSDLCAVLFMPAMVKSSPNICEVLRLSVFADKPFTESFHYPHFSGYLCRKFEQ